MDQNLLLCLKKEPFSNLLAEYAGSEGFKIQVRYVLPSLDEFESFLPDIILLDAGFITPVEGEFLKDVSKGFPSIVTYVLADPTLSDEMLFSALKSGAHGWLFKEKAEQVLTDLREQLEHKHFFKPHVSQLILDEFRKFADGEPLLAVEEEILRQSARALSSAEIRKNLNLSDKLFQRHWESIWQKLNINDSARKEIAQRFSPSGGLRSAKDENEETWREPVSSATPQPALADFPEGKASNSEVFDHKEEVAQLVTFCLGREEFAFSIRDLQEIQRMLPITPLPGSKPYVLGVANLRGAIIPVLDVRAKLGLEFVPLTKEARIVVVNLKEKVVGIVVDRVKEVIRVSLSQIEAPPSLAMNGRLRPIESVLTLENRLILVLDLVKTLSEGPRVTREALQMAGE